MKQAISRPLLFLAVLVSIPIHSYAQPKAISPGEYIYEGGWGTLTITRNKKGGLAFDISTIGTNAHTCSLSGDMRNGRAELEASEQDKPCVVTFTPSAKGVEVTDNDNICHYYCGMRAGFTGSYIKPPPGCESRAMQKTRAEFKRLYDRKAYAQARAKLEPLLKNCSELIHWSDMGWIRNDLAITQYKLGDYAGCRATLQPLVEDSTKTEEGLRETYAPTDAEIAMPIARATRTNLRLCTAGKKQR